MNHLNRLLPITCLALLLGSACSANDTTTTDAVASDGVEVAELTMERHDASGEHAFRVDVRYGAEVSAERITRLMESLEILPLEAAFPDADPGLVREARNRSLAVPLTPDGIQVTLESLDGAVDVAGYAWRADAMLSAPETSLSAEASPASSELGVAQEALREGDSSEDLARNTSRESPVFNGCTLFSIEFDAFDGAGRVCAKRLPDAYRCKDVSEVDFFPTKVSRDDLSGLFTTPPRAQARLIAGPDGLEGKAHIDCI